MSTIYNMRGRVLSDIQTRVEGQRLYMSDTTRRECCGEVVVIRMYLNVPIRRKS